jgi:hypothetical protein
LQEARTEQLLQLPFMQGFAKVYHELPSWQAKRKHLSMFAPYFPYEARSTTPTLALTQTQTRTRTLAQAPALAQLVLTLVHTLQVTRRVFGVSRWKVYAAKLHASTHGAAVNVPTSVVAYRVKPEAAAAINAFANDPSNVQLLAHNKGASHVSVALKQVPEKLYKKYEAEVPPELRVSRSKFLEFFQQPVFCLMRSKSCLCGPCTEHGTQVCGASSPLAQLHATCCLQRAALQRR